MATPTNNPAPTTDYATAYKEVGNAFALPTHVVQHQQAQALQAKNTALSQLASDRKTNLSSLDQAKTNAFTNNALTSNARGIMYSGYTPFTNNAYTVNTYNPGVQKTNTDYSRGVSSTKTSYGNTMTSLRDKINQINQARANAAQSLVLGTKADQAQAARAAASGGSGGGSGRSSGGSLPQGISYKNGASGQKGFNFNLSGSPVSAARYAQLTGLKLPTLLKQMGAEGDVTAARAYEALVKSKGKWTPAIQNKFSSIFWGV